MGNNRKGIRMLLDKASDAVMGRKTEAKEGPPWCSIILHQPMRPERAATNAETTK